MIRGHSFFRTSLGINTVKTPPTQQISLCFVHQANIRSRLQAPCLMLSRRTTVCRLRLICLVSSFWVSHQPTRNGPTSSCTIR